MYIYQIIDTIKPNHQMLTIQNEIASFEFNLSVKDLKKNGLLLALSINHITIGDSYEMIITVK